MAAGHVPQRTQKNAHVLVSKTKDPAILCEPGVFARTIGRKKILNRSSCHLPNQVPRTGIGIPSPFRKITMQNAVSTTADTMDVRQLNLLLP